MMEWLRLEKLYNMYQSLGLGDSNALLATSVTAFAAAVVVACLLFLLFAVVLDKKIAKLVQSTPTRWDDFFYRNKVFRRLFHFIPALLIHHGARLTLSHYPVAVESIQTLAALYMVVVGVLVADSILDSIHNIYNTYPVARNRSIKGLLQTFKIVLYILSFGISISIILQKDLTSFFAGLGAAAAVIMLIFKDSILGFVAGVQLSVNDMVRLGDWIEMPSRGVDGDVIDISLNTVKVRNWDQTISTIPPYALISETFTNWRGMTESGGRRIKRSIAIDMKSIHFLDKEEIARFKKIQLLHDYLEQREAEVERYNLEHNVDSSFPVNGRRLTNVGTFRAYVQQYLRANPDIHQNMTFLVRQLQPSDKGLPIEIYVFSKDQRWVNYEGIQADIFDHILAVIPLFGLSVYQSPSGNDLAAFLQRRGNAIDGPTDRTEDNSLV